MLSAGEIVPECVLGWIEEALDCVLAVEGLTLGGRIECFLLGKPAAGRGRPAIDCFDPAAETFALGDIVYVLCDGRNVGE